MVSYLITITGILYKSSYCAPLKIFFLITHFSFQDSKFIYLRLSWYINDYWKFVLIDQHLPSLSPSLYAFLFFFLFYTYAYYSKSAAKKLENLKAIKKKYYLQRNSWHFTIYRLGKLKDDRMNYRKNYLKLWKRNSCKMEFSTQWKQL